MRIDPREELHFIVHEMQVAIAEQAEGRAVDAQIPGVKNTVLYRERGRRLLGVRVARSGHDAVEDARKRAKKGNGEHIAVGDGQLARPVDLARFVAVALP